MKRLVLCAALVLSPFAGSCASTPGYGEWVTGDYCAYSAEEARGWRLTEAPADADAYRSLADAREDYGEIPDGSREFWFARADGAMKYCLTNLQRAGRHREWCDPKQAVWWEFRRTEAGLVHDGAKFRVCLT